MLNSISPGVRRFAASFAAAFLLALQAGCTIEKQLAAGRAEDLKVALATITADDLLRHIKTLSSDEFEGRAPGTRGETLTVEYLIAQFKKIGLSPGNPDGTYVQNVPMIALKGVPDAAFIVGKQKLHLRCPEDYVAISRHNRKEIAIDRSGMILPDTASSLPNMGGMTTKMSMSKARRC